MGALGATQRKVGGKADERKGGRSPRGPVPEAGSTRMDTLVTSAMLAAVTEFILGSEAW